MIKALSVTLGIALLSCSSGCLFSKKSNRPKESSAIAADVEASFRRRWIDKRLTELAAQGLAGDAARAQAEKEFGEKYVFTRPGQK
jgi:hypothetical protein